MKGWLPMANVPIDQLAAEILKAVKEYTDDVAEAVEKKVDEVADLVLEEVKRTAPKRTGKYRRGFVKTNRDEPGRVRRFVWNRRRYMLVHLLEFGHAKRGGGRVAARPHLRPAYDKYVPKLLEEIKRIIRNGGGHDAG